MPDLFPFSLPTALDVAGNTYDIRTDYRDILRILLAFDDPDLENAEKMTVCLQILYVDVDKIPPQDLQEAVNAAMKFIDHGQESDGKSARSMDWEQDAPLLFPAVNRVAGTEVRSLPYLHWWTFTGYFMEIRDSIFSSVLSLRQKRNRGKKLEKQEQEFWKQNAKICVLKKKLSEAEKQEKARAKAAVDALFG